MRVNTEVLIEAADEYKPLCRQLEKDINELEYMQKELNAHADLAELCLRLTKLQERLEKELAGIRQMGTALHNIARIYDGAEVLIADHSDGSGFRIKVREQSQITDLKPLRESYTRAICGENLLDGETRDNERI